LNDTVTTCQAEKIEIAIELNKLKQLQKNDRVKNAELQKIIERQKLELTTPKRRTSRTVINKSNSTLPPKVDKIKKTTKSANYLSANNAITIHSLKCFDGGKGSGTIYKGVIKNVSRNGIYSAELKVSFLYRKNRKEFRLWDSQNKFFQLKPMQSKNFKFESRIALDSFEMKCSLEVTKSFVKGI